MYRMLSSLPKKFGRIINTGSIAGILARPTIHAYVAAKADPAFQTELDYYLEHYVGRPSPLFFAERLTRHLGGVLDRTAVGAL